MFVIFQDPRTVACVAINVNYVELVRPVESKGAPATTDVWFAGDDDEVFPLRVSESFQDVVQQLNAACKKTGA